MKKLILSILTTLAVLPVLAANKYDNPDTLFVSRDGTCEFRTIDEAIEVCRAFMDYTKVIYVKKGVYKEKLIIPSWLTHITICGEDRDQTIITWDDHANIKMPTGGLDSEAAVKGKPIGTFRTYTLKVQGSYITLKNITIENNAARLGQAVALHTEGDHILVQNCRLLGNQDTVYTGVAGTRIRLLHRGDYRLHLRSFHRLVRELRNPQQVQQLYHSRVHTSRSAVWLRVP